MTIGWLWDDYGINMGWIWDNYGINMDGWMDGLTLAVLWDYYWLIIACLYAVIMSNNVLNDFGQDFLIWSHIATGVYLKIKTKLKSAS